MLRSSLIQSFRNRETEAVWQGQRTRKFQAIQDRARLRLAFLNSATSLATLRAIPGYALEALKGDRQGQWSIRVNDQYRICFEWSEKGPSNVELVDYH